MAEFWLNLQPNPRLPPPLTDRVPLFEWSQSFHLNINRNRHTFNILLWLQRCGLTITRCVLILHSSVRYELLDNDLERNSLVREACKRCPIYIKNVTLITPNQKLLHIAFIYFFCMNLFGGYAPHQNTGQTALGTVSSSPDCESTHLSPTWSVEWAAAEMDTWSILFDGGKTRKIIE